MTLTAKSAQDQRDVRASDHFLYAAPTVFGALVFRSPHQGAFQSGRDGRPFVFAPNPEDGPLFMITHGEEENILRIAPGVTLEQRGYALVGKVNDRLCFETELIFVAAIGHDAQELIAAFRVLMQRAPH